MRGDGWSSAGAGGCGTSGPRRRRRNTSTCQNGLKGTGLVVITYYCLLLLVGSTAAPTSQPDSSNRSPSTSTRVRTRRPQSPSPWDQGLRPSPSLDLPITGLIEPSGRRYDPRQEDLEPMALRMRLGRHFDPRFMSVKKPVDASQRPNGTVEFPFRRNQRGRLVPLGSLPRPLRRLDFKHLRLPDGTRLRTRVTRKLRRKLQQFLWAYTACPVVWKWSDLGLRFWPRWLKTGECPKDHSCSIPPGMGCQASRSEEKVVLRWHCQDWDLSRVCKWLPVRFPIITGCSCSCISRNS